MADILLIPLTELKPHPNQPRAKETGVKELAESIKAVGQVSPIVVVPNDKGYYIVDGHCRVAALKKAGIDHAKAIVYDDATVESTDKLLSTCALMASNVARTDFTDHEKAQGYQKIFDLGITEEAIAKISGETERDVKRYVALKELDTKSWGSKVATLDEAEALLYAQQNREWYAPGEKELLEAMERDDFEHAYARLKQKVSERQQIQKLLDKYPGVSVIEQPYYESQVKPLSQLKDKQGKQLDRGNHASCPGHCAYVSGWKEKTLVFCCDDPKKYGHKVAKQQPTPGSQQEKDLTKQREGRQFKKDMIAPTEVRRAWIENTLLKMDVAKIKGIWTYVLASMSERRPSTRPDLYWEWMHKKRPASYHDSETLAKFVGKTALKGVLVACLVTDDEDCRMCQGPSHFRASAMPRYLTFLADNGYKLSDHEKQLLTYTPPVSQYASYSPDPEDVEYEDSVSSNTEDVD